ncbi:MAG TPA: S16 family serine protease [Nocardioidaceae bacterium]|nr:S16 family serine protease [Nocardioidaceae bacterium]
MNRRSVAIVIGFVLLAGLGAVASFAPMPYVRYAAGPTFDVLGKQGNGKPIVFVRGHKTYATDGELRMTTVRTSNRDTKLTLVQALLAWVDPDQALYPRSVIYPDDGTTEEQDRTESQLQMVSSQDNAVAAALTELGFDLDVKVQVRGTVAGGAAEGVLQAHDVLAKVNGEDITTAEQVGAIIGALTPGDNVTIDIVRGGRPRTVEITTKAASDDPNRAVIGIFPGLGFQFPFDVDVRIPEAIGGPSAGLIFSLAVYDSLTPGALTGGHTIAGTGTIDEAGRVGPIGGIAQKIAGAEEDGAEMFLVPPSNCDEAVLAHTGLRLVRADTMASARAAIEKFVANPSADLPTCPGDS